MIKEHSYSWDKNEVIAARLSGMTYKQIREEFNISSGTVIRLFQQEGVIGKVDRATWTANRKFFDGNTVNAAYWAGFIMADGNIRYQRGDVQQGILTIDLKIGDIQHLRDFSEAMESTYPVHERQGSGKGKGKLKARVEIRGENLVQSLERWGVVPNKTQNWRKPDFPENLLPHYLRGWADGDGHFTARKVKRGKNLGCRFVVVGNKEAMQWYGEALIQLGYKGHVGKIDRGSYGGIEICSRQFAFFARDILRVKVSPVLERRWKDLSSVID